jgi:hypothetical protein
MLLSATSRTGRTNFIVNRKKLVAGILVTAALLGAPLFFSHRHNSDPEHSREELLARLPGDSTSVVYLDLGELRTSAFLAKILAWAPKPPADEQYKKFVQATGFDYERDLDRVGISFSGTPQNPKTMAIAEGRFDQKKIEAYNARFGTLKTANGKTIYAVTLSDPPRTAYFTFFRNDQVAICNDASCFFQPSGKSLSAEQWREHFLRMAGTPLFCVMRQDSALLSDFSQHSAGGWRSPQLAGLLGQLQWVSVAAKPDGDQLRVVAEGESSNETTIRQLNDMLGGLLILAQAGLDDPKASKQLDPDLRDAYRNLLKTAEVQKQDRGSSQSVRLILEITPQLLESARGAMAADPPAPVRK